jgi:hypothetical protein
VTQEGDVFVVERIDRRERERNDEGGNDGLTARQKLASEYPATAVSSGFRRFAESGVRDAETRRAKRVSA